MECCNITYAQVFTGLIAALHESPVGVNSSQPHRQPHHIVQIVEGAKRQMGGATAGIQDVDWGPAAAAAAVAATVAAAAAAGRGSRCSQLCQLPSVCQQLQELVDLCELGLCVGKAGDNASVVRPAARRNCYERVHCACEQKPSRAQHRRANIKEHNIAVVTKP